MKILRFAWLVSLATCLGCFALSRCPAAPPTIVNATAVVQPAQLVSGSKGDLRVSIRVSSGFHINANKPNDPNLIPTAITVSGPKSVQFGAAVYPKAQAIKETYEKLPMLVYQGSAVIVVPFTVAKSAQPGKIALKASLSYQGCNAESCYPPASVAVSARASVK